jgi:hypothetical protein
MLENLGQFVMSVSTLHTLSRESVVSTEYEKDDTVSSLSQFLKPRKEHEHAMEMLGIPIASRR